MIRTRPSLKHALAFLLMIAASFVSAQEEDKALSRLDRRSEKLANSIRDIQAAEHSMIPAEILRKAKGLIILKQYEAGAIFGAKGGFGVALKRKTNGEWGPPAWIKTGEISGGLQLGAQKLNVVLVILNEKSLSMLAKPKFQLGVDASVTRGPTGSNFEASLGMYSDILAYTGYDGYYAGATFEGGFLLPDRKSNEVCYGERLEVSQILSSSELKVPFFLLRVTKLLTDAEDASQKPQENQTAAPEAQPAQLPNAKP